MPPSAVTTLAPTGHPRRPGHARRAASHHRLEAGGAGVLGGDRRPGRQAEPDPLDLLGAHRLLGVEPLVGLGAVPRRAVGVHAGAEVPPDDGTRARRGHPAPALHLRGGPLRRSQLDDLLVPDPAGALRRRRHRAEAGRRVLDAPRRVAAGRRGRRELLLLDVQHRRLLPAAAQGLGPGPQRGRRQPRRRRRAARRPAGAGHGGRRPPEAAAGRLHPADHRVGDGRRAVDGQPGPRHQREGRHAGGLPRPRTPGSSPSSTSARSGRSSASPSPSVRCSSTSSARTSPPPPMRPGSPSWGRCSAR